MVAKNAPDQLVVNGIVGDGAVVSFPIRGGMTRGIAFLFEIHGEKGDLALSATSRASMQRQELTVRAAQGDAEDLAELPVPAKYRWVPEGLPGDSRYNVAQLYARLGECIREGEAGQPRVRRGGHPSPPARRDRAIVGNRSEAGALDKRGRGPRFRSPKEDDGEQQQPLRVRRSRNNPISGSDTGDFQAIASAARRV